MSDLAGILSWPWLDKPLWLWLVFFGVVLGLLLLDLGLFNRHDHEIGLAESFRLSAGYIAVGALFGVAVWLRLGSVAGEQYFTGFLIEKCLSIDNVFVISLIFSTIGVPRMRQHRVLFWGILGVIVLRGLLIGLGSALVSEFGWILYLFAAFLLVTGIRLLVVEERPPEIEHNPILRLARRYLNLTPEFHGAHFFVRLPDPRHPGRRARFVTPLFLALLLIETADVVFAVDSVPAIFAITQDPYVIYTSNIFAILGLRALYFALAAMVHRFERLKYALALILIFIGGKIFYAGLVASVPPILSLVVTLLLLSGGIAASLLGHHKAPDHGVPPLREG
jgi:tellurite resistance protein TerC